MEEEYFIVLCDLESIQPYPLIHKNHTVYYFISTYSAVDNTKYTNVHMNYSNSTDASDHFMTFTASKLAIQYPKYTFIIVSRDKFSGILTQLLQDEKRKVIHFKNASAYNNYVKSFTNIQ
jgi:hypothetical protein